TRTCSLPFAANSGQYAATGASRSTRPRSASMSTARLVTVLVVDQTFTIVSRSQGRVRASSAKPPQTSATVCPSTSTASDRPHSAPEARLSSRMSRRGSNRASSCPRRDPLVMSRLFPIVIDHKATQRLFPLFLEFGAAAVESRSARRRADAAAALRAARYGEGRNRLKYALGGRSYGTRTARGVQRRRLRRSHHPARNRPGRAGARARGPGAATRH